MEFEGSRSCHKQPSLTATSGKTLNWRILWQSRLENCDAALSLGRLGPMVTLIQTQIEDQLRVIALTRARYFLGIAHGLFEHAP